MLPPPRSRITVAAICLAAVAASAQQTPVVSSFAPVPPGNQVYIGAWPDLSTYDTPASLNARLGLNFPIFQLAQSIPLPAYDYTTGAGGESLFSYVEETSTNAAYFMTVYPDTSGALDAVQDSDLVSMAQQIAGYQSRGRTVYLRFAPEMGGIWNVYGLQPTLFKAVWARMYAIVKQIAPATIVVWSPNSSYGYPSGATLADVVLEADKLALDTNGDGQLTSADNAFSPYYPGDDQIDWAGVSLYYKGPGFQDLNEPQPGGFCANILVGNDPFYAVTYTPFYSTYCAAANRPCILSEAGAAYHVNVTGGSTQLEMQQAWWQDCLTNTTFYDLFPNIKSVFMFEHAKAEFDGGVEDYRDYRIMNASDTIAGFQAAVIAMGDRLVWANSTLTGLQSVDLAVSTVPPTSPVPTSTGTYSTILTGLSSGFETVTFTSTGFSTPDALSGSLTASGLSIEATAIVQNNQLASSANRIAAGSCLVVALMTACLLFL